MPVVTKDTTSLKWFPASNAEATSWLASSTVAVPNPDSIYGCQDVSGGFVDANATLTLSQISGTASFQQTIAGYTRKGVTLAPAASSTTAEEIGNTHTAASALAFGIVAFPATAIAGNPQSVISLGNAFGSQVALNSNPASSYQINLDDAGGGGFGGTTVTTTLSLASGVHSVIVQANTTTTTGTVQTDRGETITHAMGADTINALIIGGNNANSWYAASAVSVLGLLHWRGANAEMSATQRATIFDRYNNGPAVTSIAVTPASFTLATLGSTQQMTATATRADTSTYDASATATWLSSAPGVATVSATGLVTAIANGTANITASFTSLNAAAATSPAQVVTVSAGGGSPVINPGASARITSLDPLTVLGIGVWR